jgi:thioredoxin-related protein
MYRFLITLILAVLSLPTNAEPPEGYHFIAFDKALKQSVEQNKPLFVYFGRYGCGYCDKTNREAFSDKEVHKLYSAHYVLAYVDSESGKRLHLPSGERITERELGTRYNAFVTPVFTFMAPDGQPIYRLVGVQRIQDLLEADAKVQRQLSGSKAQ